MNRKWLIWNHERGMWWRACSNGYTNDRTDAGRYTFAEALAIVEQANRYNKQQELNETMCPDYGQEVEG